MPSPKLAFVAFIENQNMKMRSDAASMLPSGLSDNLQDDCDDLILRRISQFVSAR